MREGRLLDLGTESPLRSISVFHTVARQVRPGDGPTLILVRPSRPFVLVGYHQVLEKEVDEAACDAMGLPVYRREVGGGTVLLDENQLFFHLILPERQAPPRIADRYAMYTGPAIETYRGFGIRAEYRPVNDIQVNGRKIGGTGGATIGEAAVFVGSIMLDFDHDLMARVLKVPGEKMRDKIRQSLRDYITTMQRELGRVPPLREIKAELVRQFEVVLAGRFFPASLTRDEKAALTGVEDRLTSPDWLRLMDRSEETVRSVKICEAVYVREAAYKAPGGLIRTTLRLNRGIIEDVLVSGDFYCYPPEGLDVLRRLLAGAPVEEAEERVAAFLSAGGAEMPGITPADIGRALAAAAAE